MKAWSQLDRVGKIGAIFRLTRDGKTAAEIADCLSTNAPHVNALARAEGITLNRGSELKAKAAESVGANQLGGDIWSRSEDDRRRLFSERAKRAARKRLAEIEAENARQSLVIPTSPRSDGMSVDAGASALATSSRVCKSGISDRATSAFPNPVAELESEPPCRAVPPVNSSVRSAA